MEANIIGRDRQIQLNSNIDVLNRMWNSVFNLQFEKLQGYICRDWIEGFSKLGLDQSRVPDVTMLNAISERYTGWTFYQTDKVFTDSYEWMRMQYDKEMNISNFVRTPDELYYCDEPDKFHDILGHIPFLMQEKYSAMYQQFGKLFTDTFDQLGEKKAREVDNMAWFITEVGIINENNSLKAFGATLYSSSGELERAFAPETKREQFSLDKFLSNQGRFNRKKLMESYYIIDGVDEIVSILDTYRKMNGIKLSN